MIKILIDTLSVPKNIKDTLKKLEHIDITREIKKGGNGYLFLGTHNILGTEVAIKFYYWSDEAYHVEPKTLATINSSNVLKVFDAGLVDNEWSYFVTPCCKQGDLDDMLQKNQISNIDALDITCQLLDGITHLHSVRYLHRDLKPANIYLDDKNQAIIGDFGSIKLLPIGSDSIPTSSHSILYRPPESIEKNTYGFSGDIYQAGIVLFQLLGGNLPYNEMAWLSKQEKVHYNSLSDDIDKTLYVDECIKNKIVKGKIIDISTLPVWVPDSLKRIVKTSTHKDLAKRFSTASAFRTKLNNIRSSIPAWSIKEGVPHLAGVTEYQIITIKGAIVIQKRRAGSQDWKRDNSIKATDAAKAVKAINKKLTGK